MATYIMLASYTQQGAANIKDSPKRLNKARELGKKLGVTLKEFYLCMGSYDMVVIVEARNDEKLAQFILALGSAGNVRTTTLHAFTEAQYRRIIKGVR